MKRTGLLRGWKAKYKSREAPWLFAPLFTTLKDFAFSEIREHPSIELAEARLAELERRGILPKGKG
jgi:hypothetical protein